MKKLILLTLLIYSPHLFATTWYVDHIGGNRYSSNVTTGLCDGTSDTAPVGTTPNQHCAFNDVRYLWADSSYTTGSPFPGWGAIGASGDTYIIKDCIQYSSPGVTIPGSSGDCRIGYSGPNSGDYFLAIAGNPGNSGAPLFPNGTSGAHTQVLGANYASCTSPSAKTKLYGGYGTGSVLNLRGSNYVDVACFDITDHSSCGRSGTVNNCATGYPVDDYANNGISWSRTTTNTTLTNVSIHGMASAGMTGPTGDGVVIDHVSLSANDNAGWNLDPGDGTTGTGSLVQKYLTIQWSGCNEQYPITNAVPVQNCSDDTSGGYGDGWGTTTSPSSPGWQVSCDHCTFAYNTQDGLDALHVNGAGSTVSATNSLFYGNMGNQLKIGGSAPTVINNLIYGNCNALRQAIPGTPTGYNSALGDFCRAGDDAIALSISDNYTSNVQFNTVVGANLGAWLIVCGDTCTHPVINFNNNVLLGFQNNVANGYPSGSTGNYIERIYFDSPVTQQYGVFLNPGSSFSYNASWHEKDSCPNTNETNAICVDPQLATSTWSLYGYWPLGPATAGSPIVGSGLAIAGVTTDYAGNARPNPPSTAPSRGALEFGGAPPVISPTLLNGRVKLSGNVRF